MIENFKIIGSFIKDMSSETPDVLTYLYVRENISNYKLNIDIASKPVRDGIIEINIVLKYKDPKDHKKKSYFEINYTSVVKVNTKITEKKELEKIILCDVPSKIYPNLEKIFLGLLINSGFPGIKWESKIDFFELYKRKNN